MKDNSNTSIRHRYPYHEGEEATALRKEKWEARKGRRKGMPHERVCVMDALPAGTEGVAALYHRGTVISQL